jgi:hypothetical protein
MPRPAFERAGMKQIRPVAPESGVTYVAVKPPVEEGVWQDRDYSASALTDPTRGS